MVSVNDNYQAETNLQLGDCYQAERWEYHRSQSINVTVTITLSPTRESWLHVS